MMRPIGEVAITWGVMDSFQHTICPDAKLFRIFY